MQAVNRIAPILLANAVPFPLLAGAPQLGAHIWVESADKQRQPPTFHARRCNSRDMRRPSAANSTVIEALAGCDAQE
jgi:hypothetical protein